jgi:hypothetical protein
MALPFLEKVNAKKYKNKYSTLHKKPNKGFARLVKKFKRVSSRNITSVRASLSAQ